MVWISALIWRACPTPALSLGFLQMFLALFYPPSVVLVSSVLLLKNLTLDFNIKACTEPFVNSTFKDQACLMISKNGFFLYISLCSKQSQRNKII